MLTTSREFVLNDDKETFNNRLSRTNDLFSQEQKQEEVLEEKSRSSFFERLGEMRLTRRESEDAKPSAKTMDTLRVEAPVERQQMGEQMSMFNDVKKSSVSINTKGKIIIACFLVAVLALSFFIVLGAVNLNKSMATLEAQQTSINNARAEIEALEKDISAINSTELQSKALSAGYGIAEESHSFSLLSLSENTIPVSTNWFDSLCDALSRVFG